jgi:hypothetical protein
VEVIKEPRVEEVWARLGKYLLSKLLFYIAKQNQPIDLRVLVVKVLQKALGEVPLPLVCSINRNYRRILNVSRYYKERGYLKFSVFNSQPRKEDEDLIFIVWYLHRYLRRRGELPFESWQSYKFKALGFKELIDGAILPVFVVADHLLIPRTKENLVERTSYTQRTVEEILVALRYLGFLHREGREYVLKGEKEKILELFNAGVECKKRWIQRIRKFLKAKELFAQSLSIRKISREINADRKVVRNWFQQGLHPRLKLKTAQLFLDQRLIDEAELSIWQREGILY